MNILIYGLNPLPVVLNAGDAVVAVVAAAVRLVAAVQTLLHAVAHQGQRHALAEATRSGEGGAGKLPQRVAL